MAASPLLSGKSVALALLFAITSGIASGLFADWLHEEAGFPRIWTGVAALVVLAISAVLFSHRVKKALRSLRTGPVIMTASKEGNVKPAEGLIALVSIGRGRSSVVDAVFFHKETLRHIWLIRSLASEQDAQIIKNEIRKFLPPERCDIHDDKILDDPDDIDDAFHKVKVLRRRASRDFRIADEDLICDFTGMTKAASAGMVLACAQPGKRLQYMRPMDKDEHGYPTGETRSLPREIHISYRISEPD